MKSSIPGSKKVAKKGSRKGRIEDYDCLNSPSTVAYLQWQNAVLERFQLNFPSLRDFLTIYYNHINTNTGLKPSKLITKYHNSYGTMRTVYQRLSTLKDRGLVNCIDNKYYPTESAIAELNKLLKSA